jgi:tetratricopeptide (TPR) repeat protein
MSEINPPDESVVPLTRVAHARPRVLRVLLGAALLGVLAVAVVLLRHAPSDCAKAARTARAAEIVLTCQREYDRTGDPEAGMRLADAYRRAGNNMRAAAIADTLLVTSARGGALRVLGKVAESQKRYDAAIAALEAARDLHRAEGRHLELAKDLQALAGIHTARKQFAPAARMLDVCIGEAKAAGDEVIEGYCHVSAAFVLARAGSVEGAQYELDLAQPQMTEGRDLAWWLTEQANLYQERRLEPLFEGRPQLTLANFEKALRLAQRAGLISLEVSIELNLAFSLAELRKPADAERHLQAAAALDRDDAHATDRAMIAARIAYRRDNLTLAYALNERVYPSVTDGDDRIGVCAMQARISTALQDLAGAERWARRGVDEAERLHAGQPTIEYRSWVLSIRREPYELLFVTLARAGRLDDAVEVFDRWQGRALLGEMTAADQPLDLRKAARRFEKLGAWLSVVSVTPLMQPGGGRVGSALRATDVLALVLADHDVWCVTSSGGQLRIVDLGPSASLKPRLDAFAGKPTERALADELGELLLRDGVFRETGEPLRVVLDAPLSTLPIAALRRGGRPLIDVRPIVHAPRLSEVACAPKAHGPRTLIALADAAGDLPQARDDADLLAGLGARTAVGPDATSEALFGAGAGDVLHVAVHGGTDERGGYLALHDQQVHAAEIAARRLAPSLVFLSACESAAPSHQEFTGSLALAFHAAGSPQVIATLTDVGDASAHELIERFYREGGIEDPVRVMARVQASLIDSNTDWPNFVVFGHATCHVD